MGSNKPANTPATDCEIHMQKLSVARVISKIFTLCGWLPPISAEHPDLSTKYFPMDSALCQKMTYARNKLYALQFF
jgi:hypothetical protein